MICVNLEQKSLLRVLFVAIPDDESGETARSGAGPAPHVNPCAVTPRTAPQWRGRARGNVEGEAARGPLARQSSGELGTRRARRAVCLKINLKTQMYLAL